MKASAKIIGGISGSAHLLQWLKSATARIVNISGLRSYIGVEPTGDQELYWDSTGTLTYTITSNTDWTVLAS